MKPVVIVCTCGLVKKFGEWIKPTAGQLATINNGTYQRDYQSCTPCSTRKEIKTSIFGAKD